MAFTSVTALALAAAASADNYKYAKTSADVRAASRIVITQRDLPGAFGLRGGKTQPDESPQTAADACRGRFAKESDLVVTGDAASRLINRASSVEVSTHVRVFRTAAMASANWARELPLITANCIRNQMSHDKSVRFVWYRRPAPDTGYKNLSFLVDFEALKDGKPQKRLVEAFTLMSRGRAEGTITTLMIDDTSSPSTRLGLAAHPFAAVRLARRLNIR